MSPSRVWGSRPIVTSSLSQSEAKGKNQEAKRTLIPNEPLKTAASYIRNAAMVTPCGGWGYAPAMQAEERAPLGLRGLGEDFDFSP